ASRTEEATAIEGVWLCDLSAARSLSGVLEAIAEALAVPLRDVVEDDIARLGRAIARRGRVLLILDNFQPVVGFGRATVGGWLRAAPRARFLVTSRERLRIEGEACLPLSPLPPPDAARLFVDRARAAAPSFTLRPEDEEVVAAIAERLDGIP